MAGQPSTNGQLPDEFGFLPGFRPELVVEVQHRELQPPLLGKGVQNKQQPDRVRSPGNGHGHPIPRLKVPFRCDELFQCCQKFAWHASL
jgi:hypothetical protein